MSEQVEDRRSEVGEAPAGREARAPGAVTTSGTGFVVWAVCGLTPSASSICSALPWSAVTRQTPPSAAVASTTRPSAASAASTAADDGRDHARVADHVGIREVDDAEAVALRERARRPRRRRPPRTSPASGRSSATSRGEGTSTRVSPSHSASSPPLKKYVTCAYFSVSAACSWRMPAPLSISASVSAHLLLRERDRRRDVLGVPRHRRQVDARLEQPPRELAAAVGPEVEEDRRVDRRDRGAGRPGRRSAR